ncbi:hypothetical protein PGB90_009964 [Kerria lacca]
MVNFALPQGYELSKSRRPLPLLHAIEVNMNVLCLKLRNRHAVWNPATSPPYFEDSIPSELGYASIQKKLALKAFHRKKSKPP